jgi:hypothetical protein
MVYETTYGGRSKGLANLSGSRPNAVTSTTSSGRTAMIAPKQDPAVQGPPKSTFKEDFKEGLKEEADWIKIRAGSTAIGTGAKIARAAAIVALADGPLPIGDIIAAGILVGGGIYLLGSGMDWW